MKTFFALMLFSQLAQAQKLSVVCSTPKDQHGNLEKMELYFRPNGDLLNVVRISGWHWCSNRKVSKIVKTAPNTYDLSYVQTPRELPCYESTIVIKGPTTIEHIYDNYDGEDDAPTSGFSDILSCK